jgi:hypothetical protein
MEVVHIEFRRMEVSNRKPKSCRQSTRQKAKLASYRRLPTGMLSGLSVVSYQGNVVPKVKDVIVSNSAAVFGVLHIGVRNSSFRQSVTVVPLKLLLQLIAELMPPGYHCKYSRSSMQKYAFGVHSSTCVDPCWFLCLQAC